MKVVITGGCGFLGTRVARRILERGRLVDAGGQVREVTEVRLLDRVPSPLSSDSRVRVTQGDLGAGLDLGEVLGRDAASVFHLAAIVSGEAEADFDAGMRVNLEGSRALLEWCRGLPQPPRLVFASSVAVFGCELPARVPDSWAVTPQNSYGTQKAIVELLVNDYSRKGFVDGRVLRLPTVSVRPGKPNRAASSFASGIIREPLAGVEAVCPIGPEVPIWIMSPEKAVENLLLAHELPASAFGASRVVSLPGLSTSAGAMAGALERVAGRDVAARVRWVRDPAIERIVASWPGDFDAERALRMGFSADADFESVIRTYLGEQPQ